MKSSLRRTKTDQGLQNKFVPTIGLYSGGYDVVSVCEIWLNDCVLDSELLSNYSIFRKDRVGKTGGGVWIAVKDTVRVKERNNERNKVELDRVVEHFKANNQSIILYTFYRPLVPHWVQHQCDNNSNHLFTKSLSPAASFLF